MNNLQKIVEAYPEDTFLSADGFEDAIIGRTEIMNEPPRLVYSLSKILAILLAEGMTEEDAREHMSYNVTGGYVGEQTPIFVDDEILV